VTITDQVECSALPLTQTGLLPATITMSYTQSMTEAFAFEHGFENDPNYSDCVVTYSLVVVASPDGLGASHDFI